VEKLGKVVLAYSGGLDTSVIIPWLQENYDCDIIAMVADVGQNEDLDAIEEKAYNSVREEFLRDYVLPTMQAGAIYEGKYLLGTAMARPLIARCQIATARQEGAAAVAHGCTGKGNDQVRFELTYKALMPEVKVIAPWRLWSIRSREDAIDYARRHGIPVPATKEKPFSMDRNLWHISYEGGILEDPWQPPPADMFVWTTDPEQAPDRPETVTVGFEGGKPVSVNGQRLGLLELMEQLNSLGARHGIGRADLVENRLVGMKSRGVYETPGGTILYTAHHELETLTLDRETMHYKELVAVRYAELVYFGQWYSPLKKALDGFVQATQTHVTGEVKLKLYKGNISIVGRRAERSLYREDLATFGADDVYDHKDAGGFINLFGLPLAVAARLQPRE